MQCEYDPKCCSCCKKPGAGKSLRSCAKCKTAKYCGKECQTQDWKEKHKLHCQEIRRLQGTIDRDETNAERGFTRVKAIAYGKPWFLDRGIEYYKLCIRDDRFFVMGFHMGTKIRSVLMYNATSGDREGKVCHIDGVGSVIGMCTIQVAGTKCLAISRAVSEFTPWLIEFWKYPDLTAQPFYTYRAPPCSTGSITVMDGKLLVANAVRCIVEEFDASCIPIKATGVQIPTKNLARDIRNICAMKRNGENRLLLQHFINDIESAIKCVDYTGRQLWHIKKQPLGGILFQPWDACTDHNGHVFTVDVQRNRVVVINEDLSLEVLTVVDGMVLSIGWCDVTRRLYVGYKNERGTHMMMTRFNISPVYLCDGCQGYAMRLREFHCKCLS